MDLKLSRKKIRLDYEGMKCELLIPTSKEIADFQKDLDSKKGDETTAINNLMLKLGMTEDILNQLDVMSLKELIEYISGKKSLK